MECLACEKDLNEYNFLSLRKYKFPKKTKCLEEAYDFCTIKCIDKFLETVNDDHFKDFQKYKISRCGAYKDCERIDNLRNMCESAENVIREPNQFPIGPLRYLSPSCGPGEVGIIRASIRLMDILEGFDTKYQESSNELINHSKNMNRLTKLILVFTLANLVLLIALLLRLSQY